MAQIYGQLQNAQLENLSADPTTSVSGRFYLNTATGTIVVDDGTAKRALLRNDGKAVFGTDTTAANNVRVHHSGVGMLQFVPGNDTTTENTSATTLAQVGFRAVNLAAAPAVGNVGRIYFNTATNGLQVDNGTAFLQFATLTGTETLTNKTLSGPAADQILFSDQSATPSTPASGVTKVYSRSGTPYKLASDGVETIIGAGGNVVNTLSKSAAYTATATDGFSFNNAASAAYTITLPSASTSAGVKLSFQKTDSTFNAVTIGTVTSLQTQNESVVILSNGSAWSVIDRNIPAVWTPYTMNIGAATTAPTKPTSRAIDLARWRRIGGDIEVQYTLQVTSSTGSSQGSGIYYFPFPTGVTVDTTVIPVNAGGTPSAGIGYVKINDGTNNFIGNTTLYSSTAFSAQGKYSNGSNATASSVTDVYQSSTYFTLAVTAPYIYTYFARAPIAAWNT